MRFFSFHAKKLSRKSLREPAARRWRTACRAVFIMANIAYFECISGASGNMILAALLDAGFPVETLRAELGKLQVSGFAIETSRVMRRGIAAAHVEVNTEETHAHRHLRHILSIIEGSALDSAVKADAARIFTRLAEAEAAIHNTSVEQIHFHEVGALDAIVDIVGAVIGLRGLGVGEIYVSPFPQGTGVIQCAHGTMPNPAPATAALLKGKPVRPTDIEAELVTPTGAAILSTLGQHFGTPPLCAFSAIGYGAGTKELPIPNVLRLSIGVAAAAPPLFDSDTVLVLETNIDDMNPQWFDYLFEKLYAAGALEVFTAPVMMKKNRPGALLTVVLPPEKRDAVAEVMLTESTSIGVRWHETPRIKAQREFQTVETSAGTVTIKISRLGSRIVNAAPEYDDCRRLAQEHPGMTLKQIYLEALAAARALNVGAFN